MFALIGLQLWSIVTAPDIGRRPVLLISGAVLLTVILIRPIWIFLINSIGRLLRRPAAFDDWRPLAAVSWAGMRGVVSLAAAQTLPLDTPDRSLLLTCTIAVILGTLVVQGLTLPTVIKWLRFPGDPAAEMDAERMAARDEANRAIAAAVEKEIAENDIPPDRAAPDAAVGGDPELAHPGPGSVARDGHRPHPPAPVGRLEPGHDENRTRRVRRPAQLRPHLRGGDAGGRVRLGSRGGAAGPTAGRGHRSPGPAAQHP